MTCNFVMYITTPLLLFTHRPLHYDIVPYVFSCMMTAMSWPSILPSTLLRRNWRMCKIWYPTQNERSRQSQTGWISKRNVMVMVQMLIKRGECSLI